MQLTQVFLVVGLGSIFTFLYVFGFSLFWGIFPSLLLVTYTLYSRYRPVIIGIFSRESEMSYAWLSNHLRSKFQTNTFYISNDNEHQFKQAVSQCMFAILYHTKRRGRINITDVTDSLYDEELKILSTKLGKKNVIVVIDDLDQSTDAVKEQLLQSQPMIRRLARDLILFSLDEKKSQTEEEQKNFTYKLEVIKKLIRGGSFLLLLLTHSSFFFNMFRRSRAVIL